MRPEELHVAHLAGLADGLQQGAIIVARLQVEQVDEHVVALGRGLQRPCRRTLQRF